MGRFEVTICDLKRRLWRPALRAPLPLTEQGVAMLSSVLGSPQAIAVNIEIMRAFVRQREVLVLNKELALRLDDENKTGLMSLKHDTFEHSTRVQLKQIFDAIRERTWPPRRTAILQSYLGVSTNAASSSRLSERNFIIQAKWQAFPRFFPIRRHVFPHAILMQP